MGLLVLASACRELPPPPGNLMIDGLPVTGSLTFARSRGFTTCLDFNAYLRCRRDGIRFAGQGPYQGAVDSLGSDGSGGFQQLVLWSDKDQYAVTAVGRALQAQGWHVCRTGQADRGDQNIWRKAGSKVRVSIDASYWGKRRLRVLPELGQPTGRCW